ncbi:hypothetical protein BN7_1438 [Wickerhamomyces ciferrii]|uniref:Golgi to ER traffic protein 4 n=1 Tax=Wickerhamomyces ciferrii (strain ATCC 14091 / BCRC 22168 / CBS 111 / JCM 3599 / NBRC 0793 / NRRL Y-1031 F-60-10) TaxID=1206466 RepID=K0KKA7_WICCF|nr:uncharacterized protein BN7_1438 [Wickerhamomyces ciferrii]CCH41899.1 hypothetical protein BN7_1438 [Wickerhamomyces ciferrii]
MSDVAITIKNPKLQRTLQRFKAKIAEGDYYEAHQTLRTIANRNVKAKAYTDAIELLYIAAQILLKSSQPATGSDLTSYLLEVYTESQTPVDSNSKSKIIQLISLFPSQEPTLKQVSIEASNWSIKFGEYPFGDPFLHDVIGAKFLENPSDLAYDAERHLLLGTSASVTLYFNLIWEWYLEDPSLENAGLYASRIVLNYLFIENVKIAKEALTKFINNLINHGKLQHESIEELNEKFHIFESVPLLNLLQLTLITIQTKNSQYYSKLKNHYNQVITQSGLNDSFDYLGELYLDIRVPKNINPLQSLMSSFLGGGGI